MRICVSCDISERLYCDNSKEQTRGRNSLIPVDEIIGVTLANRGAGHRIESAFVWCHASHTKAAAVASGAILLP